MREVSPAARVVARRVLVYEAGDPPESAALAEAVARADARLRGRLAVLIGQTGYTILVARAVRLAQAEVPALALVTIDTTEVGAEGSLRGVRAAVEAVRATSADPRAAEAALAAILAHIIGLLSTFIGEDLALRLVREAWPELAHGEVNSEGRV